MQNITFCAVFCYPKEHFCCISTGNWLVVLLTKPVDRHFTLEYVGIVDAQVCSRTKYGFRTRINEPRWQFFGRNRSASSRLKLGIAQPEKTIPRFRWICHQEAWCAVVFVSMLRWRAECTTRCALTVHM